MRWTVVWLPSAQADLARIWLADRDRRSITAASHRIDQELRVDAHLKGQDFYGDRIFQYGPLAVIYLLFPADCLVKLQEVIRIKG